MRKQNVVSSNRQQSHPPTPLRACHRSPFGVQTSVFHRTSYLERVPRTLLPIKTGLAMQLRLHKTGAILPKCQKRPIMAHHDFREFFKRYLKVGHLSCATHLFVPSKFLVGEKSDCGTRSTYRFSINTNRSGNSTLAQCKRKNGAARGAAPGMTQGVSYRARPQCHYCWLSSAFCCLFWYRANSLARFCRRSLPLDSSGYGRLPINPFHRISL